MIELLSGVRRRLRLAWGVATAQWLAPAVAAVALALVLAGRVRPWAWPEPAALALVAVAVVALVVASLVVRVPLLVAARAADRGLGTGDVFATALELESQAAALGVGATGAGAGGSGTGASGAGASGAGAAVVGAAGLGTPGIGAAEGATAGRTEADATVASGSRVVDAGVDRAGVRAAPAGVRAAAPTDVGATGLGISVGTGAGAARTTAPGTAGVNPFGERVRARAAEIAAGRRPSEAVPVRLDRRRMGVVAGLTIAAVALGLTANHQDDVRRRQEAEQQVLDAEARKLEDAAEELRTATPPTPTQEELAKRLEELARELAAAPSVPRGQEALDAAARELAAQLSPNLLAQKAAVRGLDRSLASSPD